MIGVRSSVGDTELRQGGASDASAPALLRTSRWSLVGLASGFAFVAAIVSFVAGGTRYVQDTSFEFDWNPLGLFAKYLSVWDSTRGLGDANPSFDTALSALSAVLRELGFAPAISQRIVHVVLFTSAGVGAAAVLRRWRPVFRAEHVVIGLAYMLNPFTATFLFPSSLFLNYALAPWFLLVFLIGVRATRRWRWPAAFALLVFAAGWSNAPGLVWSMLPVVAAAIYVVAVERSVTWRALAAWIVRAGLLTFLVCAAGLVKAAAGSSSLQTNLAESETPSAISLGSSWAETWRGLGFWLTYWINERGAAKPQTADYLQSLPLVLATFALPVVALVTFWRSCWRPRIFFASLIVIALPFMVGAFPFDSPSPLGRVLLDTYDDFTPLYGFRNTYKAGPALMLGVAGLVAAGVAGLVRSSGLRRTSLVGSVCAVAIVLASWPFWTGAVYDRPGMSDVPAYYRSAISWLDGRPGTGRVLVLPGSGFTTYRWGSPGDDIFDALMERTNVGQTLRPRSAPESANLIEALYDVIDAGQYRVGTLPAVLSRLGIQYVLVRNDLDWQRTDGPRPASLDLLRHDPGLRLVRSFGAKGYNVVAAGDESSTAARERQLPPVQVYEVVGGAPPVELRSPTAQVLVSGDGSAWPGLAASGDLLDRTVRYTGDLDVEELRSALGAGAPVVVTDTNRRRASGLGALRRSPGPTLTAAQPAGRDVQDLFGVTGSQTVVAPRDVESITVSGPLGFPASTPEDRVENAFDGDPGTSWLTAPLVGSLGQTIHIEFTRPMDIQEARIIAARPCCSGRVVSHVSIEFPDGAVVPVDLRSGEQEVVFRSRRVRWLNVRIDGTRGDGLRPIGIAEITLPGVSLQQVTQVPDDIFRAAGQDSTLAASLATAPITYRFAADVDTGGEETGMRRQFQTAGERNFTIDGVFALTTSTADATVDRLLGRLIGAVGTSRANGRLENSAVNAVDGRTDTSWGALPMLGESLLVRFPQQTVASLDVDVDVGTMSSPINELELRIGDTRAVAPVNRFEGPCATDAACIATAHFDVDPIDFESAAIIVRGVAARSGPVGQLPMRMAEVRVNGLPNAVDAIDATPASCVDAGLKIDGTLVPVTVMGTVRQLLASEPLAFAACGDLALPGGRHELEFGREASVQRIDLVSGSVAPATLPEPAGAELIDEDADSVRVRVTVPLGGSDLVVSRAFDPRWTATSRGRDLGRPIAADTQLSWHLDRPGTYVVELRFPPERTFRVALLISLFGVGACIVLLVVEPRRRARPQPHEAAFVRRGWVTAATVVGGFVMGGIPGVIVAMAGVVAARIASARVVALGAAVALMFAAAATAFEANLQLGPGFVSNRPIAAAAGLTAGVLLLVALVETARADQPKEVNLGGARRRSRGSKGGRRRGE
jgi:arabinofuranan 3-O-arabinosyltransferase